MRRRLPLALALLVAVAVPADAFGARAHVPGSSIVHNLRAGRTVTEVGAIVDGPVDLGDTHLVDGLFRCRACTFRGRLAAPDAIFTRTVDLTGSTFQRRVDFRGATFRGLALFGAAPDEQSGRESTGGPSRFVAGGDFSLAGFDDLASFKGAQFDAAAVFRDTRFVDAAFAAASFGSASFDGASFHGAARFNSAVFTNRATFVETEFRDRTNFSLSEFQSGAAFTGAQFADGASFLGAQFASPPGTEDPARFDAVASAGNLDFTFVGFEGGGGTGTRPRVVAVFSDLACGRSLVLRDAVFAEGARLVMDRLQVHDLVMDVGAVRLVEDGVRREQKTVLETIEESAKSRGDLATANDAHYRLRVLESENYGAVTHALDYVFYRGVAGYFVRPLRPLLVLLALVVLVSLVRELRRARTGDDPAPRSRLRQLSSTGRRRGGAFLTNLLDTFVLLGPRRRGREPRLSERLEVLTYRLLAVCALLGLANSNPTLRQMVDTLF